MRRYALPFLLTAAVMLVLATPVIAQPPQPGRYELEWSELNRGQRVDLTNGVRTVDVRTVNPGEAPPGAVVVIRDGAISQDLWYVDANGQVTPGSGFGAGSLVDVIPGELFYIQAEYGSRAEILYMAVGRRVATTPPPPPLRVFITQPKAGATVSGTVWVVMWVEGTSGSSNVFTLSVDGKVIQTTTTSSRGPVTMGWFTINNPNAVNGTHTLTATVRDATGNTGTGSITVIVKN